MSNASIESTKLYAWCDAVKKSIEKERKRQKRELAVAFVAKYTRPHWWRRARFLTVERAMEKLEKESSTFDEWWHADSFASGQYDIANKLMSAALVADRVIVDSEELAKLHYWSADIAASIFRPGELR